MPNLARSDAPTAFQRAEALVGQTVTVKVVDLFAGYDPVRVNGKGVAEVAAVVNRAVPHPSRVLLELKLRDDAGQPAYVLPERVAPEGVIELGRIDFTAIMDSADLWHRHVDADGDLEFEGLTREELCRFFVAAALTLPAPRARMAMEMTERAKVYAHPNMTRLEGVRLRTVASTAGKVERHWTGGAYSAVTGSGRELVTEDQREAWVHAACP